MGVQSQTTKKSKQVFDIRQHILVPKHEKLSQKQKQELLTKHNIRPEDLPQILITDPAIRHLNPKEGDIIKITRKSPTAGTTIYYRIVVSGL